MAALQLVVVVADMFVAVAEVFAGVIGVFFVGVEVFAVVKDVFAQVELFVVAAEIAAVEGEVSDVAAEAVAVVVELQCRIGFARRRRQVTGNFAAVAVRAEDRDVLVRKRYQMGETSEHQKKLSHAEICD